VANSVGKKATRPHKSCQEHVWVNKTLNKKNKMIFRTLTLRCFALLLHY